VGIFVYLTCDSFCVCCFLLRGMVVWCCVFLDLRLYALMCMGEIHMSVFGGSLFVFIVLLVCSARVVELGVVSVGGFMMWATCRLCCVFCRFVRFCSRLWCARSAPPALYFLL
jgi:hypothetical protein